MKALFYVHVEIFDHFVYYTQDLGGDGESESAGHERAFQVCVFFN